MSLAKLSANGQITVPVEVRRLLKLKSGDKISSTKPRRRNYCQQCFVLGHP